MHPVDLVKPSMLDDFQIYINLYLLLCLLLFDDGICSRHYILGCDLIVTRNPSIHALGLDCYYINLELNDCSFLHRALYISLCFIQCTYLNICIHAEIIVRCNLDTNRRHRVPLKTPTHNTTKGTLVLSGIVWLFKKRT